MVSGFIEGHWARRRLGRVRELIFKADAVEDLCEAFARRHIRSGDIEVFLTSVHRGPSGQDKT